MAVHEYMDLDNVDALDQGDEEEVVQSEDQGEDTPVEEGEGQGVVAPEGDDDVQPEPELQLVELPDGRKVTPEVAVEEYIQKQNIKEETSKQIFDIIVRHSIDENKILEAYKIKTIDDLDETNGQKLLKQLKTKYEV